MNFQEIIRWVFLGWYLETLQTANNAVTDARLKVWEKVHETGIVFRYMWEFLPETRQEFIVQAFKKEMYVQKGRYNVHSGAERIKCVFRH